MSAALSKPFIGLHWGHLELAIRGTAISGGTTSFLSEPVILRNMDGAGWWSRPILITIYLEYCFLVDRYSKEYPSLDYLVAEVNKSTGIRLFITALQARRNGLRVMPLFFFVWMKEHRVGKTIKSLIKVAVIVPKELSVIILNTIEIIIMFRSLLLKKLQ